MMQIFKTLRKETASRILFTLKLFFGIKAIGKLFLKCQNLLRVIIPTKDDRGNFCRSPKGLNKELSMLWIIGTRFLTVGEGSKTKRGRKLMNEEEG